MSKIWFTADQHFGHEQIVEYSKRPFHNSDYMDKEIIKRYNELVSKDDVVYHLGDLSMFRPNKKDKLINKIEQLNGTKILIFGNHDYLSPLDYVDVGFQSAHTYLHLDPVGVVCYELLVDVVFV